MKQIEKSQKHFRKALTSRLSLSTFPVDCLRNPTLACGTSTQNKTKTKMKTTHTKAAAAGLTALVIGSAAAQESVSKPVGYETIEINQQFNYVGLRLVGTALATSTVATATVIGDDGEITLDGATLEDGAVIVEVNDGDALGEVAGGTVSGGTITVAGSLLDNLAVGDSVTVRAPQTLQGLFGDPIAELDGSAGAGAADLILVPEGEGFRTFYYNTGSFGGAGAGWKEVVDGADVNVTEDVNLFYVDGLVIQNRGADNSLVVSGSVKTTPTTMVLNNQFNYLSTIYPVGSTLSTLFDDPANPGTIRPGTLDGSAGAGAADLILVPDGAGFFTYYYNTGGFGGAGAGWKQVVAGADQDIDSTTVSLDSSSAFVIQNRGDSGQTVAANAPDFYSSL